MGSLFRSIQTFFSPGSDAKESNQPETPADVTLVVPGMYWPRGWPDRVRHALGTLPWVEPDTIQTIVDRREVRFNLREKTAFNEEEMRKALKAQGFPQVTVKSV